jgi:hypothetical protein
MGTESHKAQSLGIRFLINQHQVRLNMTIAVIFPIACQSMVMMTRRKDLIVAEGIDDWE